MPQFAQSPMLIMNPLPRYVGTGLEPEVHHEIHADQIVVVLGVSADSDVELSLRTRTIRPKDVKPGR